MWLKGEVLLSKISRYERDISEDDYSSMAPDPTFAFVGGL
jgi:hypothetical protein